jgi:uncharacterized protein with NRDE domain
MDQQRSYPEAGTAGCWHGLNSDGRFGLMTDHPHETLRAHTKAASGRRAAASADDYQYDSERNDRRFFHRLDAVPVQLDADLPGE